MGNEVLQVLVAFIGGGAIFNWVRSYYDVRYARQIEYLSAQLANLYGPLCLFASEMMKANELWLSVDQVSFEEFIQKKYSDDPHTQESIREQHLQAIDVKNEYGKVLHRNNDEMYAILTKNFHFADDCDIELFMDFVKNRLRNQIEFSKDGSTLPMRVASRLDKIPIFTSDFINAIHQRFQEKRRNLAMMRAARPPWSWFFRADPSRLAR